MKKILLIILFLPLIGLGQIKDYISNLDLKNWERLTTENLSSNLITDLDKICGIQYCSYLTYASLNNYSLYEFNFVWHYAQGGKYSLEKNFDEVKLDICKRNCKDFKEPLKSYLLSIPDSNYYKDAFCYIEYTLDYMKEKRLNTAHNCSLISDSYCISGSEYCLNDHFVKTKYKNDKANHSYILRSNHVIIEDLEIHFDFDSDGYLDRLILLESYRGKVFAITKRSPDGLYEFIYIDGMSEEGKVEFRKLLEDIRIRE